jgi:hypothetical protein
LSAIQLATNLFGTEMTATSESSFSRLARENHVLNCDFGSFDCKCLLTRLQISFFFGIIV